MMYFLQKPQNYKTWIRWGIAVLLSFGVHGLIFFKLYGKTQPVKNKSEADLSLTFSFSDFSVQKQTEKKETGKKTEHKAKALNKKKASYKKTETLIKKSAPVLGKHRPIVKKTGVKSSKNIKVKQKKVTKPEKQDLPQLNPEPFYTFSQSQKNEKQSDLRSDEVRQAQQKSEKKTVQKSKIVDPAYTQAEIRARKNYEHLVYTHIQSNLIYPEKAQKRHIQGSVKLKFTIDRTGQLVQLDIIKESAYRVLNTSALKTLHHSVPFPPFPLSLSESQKTFVIPIEYKKSS